ncbi:MAG TPA: DUF2147 domain-containing protein [Treponemataceae bacterium]|jgi:uncharacterized protein (DUF2147 family)|nr:MAG: hypothetical protein BWY39_01091 [Spirochaetes bacterium ADurb.Bin269]TAH51808.1 MAG: DUF2147 domain-containing protein [Treponema sp.]HOC29388.1 DUF2147 domain-containing protein [Treponemataceae bacterium]HPX47248.1 DUF2147 domain-containing protein [Treponemataceae bacterium]HQL31679.1 DUF2147 domain-containing protein [Treponemataceae bacterium]
MKKLAALCLVAAFAAAGLSAADKVEGYWKSIDETTGKVTAIWKIYQKDSKLFGEIVTVPGQSDATIASAATGNYKDFPVSGDVSKMTVVNTPFIFNLKMKSAGQWEGGNIIDPKDGKMYKCKIVFRAKDGKKYKTDVLEMRGEIGLGIGRSQYWEKCEESEIDQYRFKG